MAAVEFIAEVSSNHGRDLERALRFIDTAAAIGCGAVKFQLFRIDSLFAPEILARSAAHRARRQWELPLEFLPELAARARRHGLRFLCTPFDLEAVEQLRPHVDGFKIASYELPWHDLLAACAATGKPVILSTGMATLAECEAAVAVLRDHGCDDLTLLHCLSCYPAPAPQLNLAAIETLRRACGCRVGWSDHSVEPGVIHRAVHRWGARVIEFHLDLEGEGAEFGAGHCWLPEPMARLIEEIGTALDADGDGTKAPAPCERGEVMWRADPGDGLRPFRELRAGFEGDGG